MGSLGEGAARMDSEEQAPPRWQDQCQDLKDGFDVVFVEILCPPGLAQVAMEQLQS